MSSTNRSFRPALFTYLTDLDNNNDREWFAENRERYDLYVRDAGLQFIRDFEPYLHEISPHFVADDRTVGGSLFRIYRDTRFSKDKTPYKTHLGIQFRHEAAKDVHAPGFYLHLDPIVARLEGESLKRPPRGFDAEHPLLEDLKRKDFIASAKISRKTATAPDFLDLYASMSRNAAGYMEFLTRSLGLPF